MTPENKQLLKAIGISAGIVLIVVSVSVIIYKSTKKEDEETDGLNPYLIPSGTERTTTTSSKTEYTKEEIKKMQGWLVSKAVLEQNTIIINAIRDTGGIDGVIGNGFHKALNEAIERKYVKDLNDLYKKSN